MINKRLLIKNILSNYDEGTFFDKKLEIDLNSDKGKSKLLKHISALANSNIQNDSFLVIGVTDDSEIKGSIPIDDANIQNLVYSNLSNPPIINYENIPFPNISNNKFVGLLTIHSSGELSSFTKNISKIKMNSIYERKGSTSILCNKTPHFYKENIKIVNDLYKYSSMTIEELLNNILGFYKNCSEEYHPRHIVFKEQFVVCLSGWEEGDFLSEVDIQIISEGVRLFFSALENVKIDTSENGLIITKYQYFSSDKKENWSPTEKTTVSFMDNGSYKKTTDFIFTPPVFNKTEILELYIKSKKIEKKFLLKRRLSEEELGYIEIIPRNYFICYLNGIKKAKKDFYGVQRYMDGCVGECFMEYKELLEKYECNNETMNSDNKNGLFKIK